MESHIFLLQLVLILFSARLAGEVAAYFKVPSVIGELLAGVFIGPSVLGLVEATHSILLLAEIGVILLLFEVGLETDIRGLLRTGLKSVSVAVGGVVIPFFLGLFISQTLFQLPLLASLFIASTLTATSIGITMRVLGDLKQQKSREAQIILGAAILDDIIGIVLLSLLLGFSNSGEVHLWNAGKVMLFILLFFLIAPFAAKLVSVTIKKWEEKSEIPGLLPTMIVSLILFFSWVAHVIGAPELLGGFAAGLALSHFFFFPRSEFLKETPEFTRRIEKQMHPIVHLFAPIFFVTVGLSLDIKAIDWSSAFIWALSGSLVIAAIFGKFVSGFFLKGESRFSKAAIGISMIPRGEVGLIFAEIGLGAKVLSNEIYAALILVICTTTLFAPFALRWLYGKVKEPRPKS